MTAGSDVSDCSEAMASIRRSMTFARRTLWEWKKATRVSRLAR
jgi:hypothetical protein